MGGVEVMSLQHLLKFLLRRNFLLNSSQRTPEREPETAAAAPVRLTDFPGLVQAAAGKNVGLK
jgi:hypothetical protein